MNQFSCSLLIILSISALHGSEVVRLYDAVTNEDSEVLRSFVADESFDINGADENGTIALHLAVEKEKPTSVGLLLSHPSIRVNCINTRGLTPLLSAVHYNNDAIVELLLGHSKIDVNATDKTGSTALSIAVNQERTRVINFLLDHPDIEVNLPNRNGITPLLLATKINNIIGARLLLSHPATKVNQVTNNTTALHVAAQQGNCQAMRLLIGNGAVDSPDAHFPSCFVVARDEQSRAIMLQAFQEYRDLQQNKDGVQRSTKLIQTTITGTSYDEELKNTQDQLIQSQQETDQLKSALQTSENQLKELKKLEKRINRLLEEQKELLQTKEDEIKSKQEQLGRAKQETITLQELLDSQRISSGEVMDRLTHLATILAQKPTHAQNYYGDSPTYHGSDQRQWGGERRSVETLISHTQSSVQKNKVCCKCDYWICRVLCCHVCCRRFKDSCKDCQFKLALY